MALNWKLDTNFLCMQFNFQHYQVPAHTDRCVFFQPKLNGGEGLGTKLQWHNFEGLERLGCILLHLLLEQKNALE